jgi:CRP-like cAMP-binding protein
MPEKNITRKIAKELSLIPCFAELNSATLEVVAQATIRRQYEAGQVVFSEGEPCEGLYFIEEGWLKAVKSATKGRQQTMRFIGPGELLNELITFTQSNNMITVVAMEPATVMIIQREIMHKLLDENPYIGRTIIQNLAVRVQCLITLVEDFSLRTIEERLARYLLENSFKGSMHRRDWATQAEIAVRLGTVLEVLNRALQKMNEEGLIRVERHQIEILDWEGLKTKANYGK